MENTDILFASLVGSKVVAMVPRFKAVQNELMKQTLPPIPFLPFSNDESVLNISTQEHLNLWKADNAVDVTKQFFPLSLSIDQGATWFRLPYEPLISISGKNVIAKRRVAKSENNNTTDLKSGDFFGTVKERWSQDDYDITITGVLIGSLVKGNYEDCFPRADFEKLRKVLTFSKHIKVACPPLELLGIHSIVIDDFSFPFTKGENVQAYEIKCCSDTGYNLLLNI